MKLPNFQGLRGIASICIMTGHAGRGLFPIYCSSADSYDATPRLFQRPILRLFSAGPFWVAVFFILSGYVCAVKPLRLANAGKVEDTRKTIASSTFRRFLRIGLPATLGTIFCWGVSQLGAGELFDEVGVECQWTTFVIVKRIPGIIAPLKSLIIQCVNTWRNEENKYERNQWTLSLEIRGSLWLFAVLNVTATYTLFCRRAIMVMAALWFYNFGHFLSSFCFFVGAILADFSLSSFRPTSTRNRNDHPEWLNRALDSWPIGLALIGLVLGSVPPENPEYATWSRVIFNFFENYITAIKDDNDRAVASFGAIFLVLSILCSPSLQSFFAQAPFVFFGNLSFAMYLLHGTFIRVPLQWAVIHILPVLVSDAVEYYDDGEGIIEVGLLCESWNCQFTLAMVLLAWFGLLVVSCMIWKKYVDVLGIQFSTWGEQVVTGKRELLLLNVEPLTRFIEYFEKNSGEQWLWLENGLVSAKKKL